MERRERRSVWLAALLLLGTSAAQAQIPPAPPPAMPRGLVAKQPGVSDGYVLFSPILSPTVFLMDNDARVVHTWHNEYGGNPDKQALIVHLLVFGGFGVCMLLDLATG